MPLPLAVYGYLRVNHVLKSIVGSSEKAQSTIVSKMLAEKFSRRTQFLAQVTFHHDKLTADDEAFDLVEFPHIHAEQLLG